MNKEAKHKNVSIANRKAWHEYHIGETFDAGLMLSGTEVKSIRDGKASITESYCKVEAGEVWIHGMHVAPFEQGNRWNVDPLRARKLLLHKGEISRINRQLAEKGLTLVPLKIYFTRGYAKISIALGRGKKLWDKREAIADRDIERDRRREEAGRY
jgi:SsrA-binding protein